VLDEDNVFIKPSFVYCTPSKLNKKPTDLSVGVAAASAAIVGRSSKKALHHAFKPILKM
jgi:hypothetical protein